MACVFGANVKFRMKMREAVQVLQDLRYNLCMSDIHWLRKLGAPHMPCGVVALGVQAERSPKKVTCQKCKVIAELVWSKTIERMVLETFGARD